MGVVGWSFIAAMYFGFAIIVGRLLALRWVVAYAPVMPDQGEAQDDQSGAYREVSEE